MRRCYLHRVHHHKLSDTSKSAASLPLSMDNLDTKVIELRAATDGKLPHIGRPKTGCTVGMD